MLRVLGHLDDLARRSSHPAEQRFTDVHAAWSHAANADWLARGIAEPAPFHVVSAAPRPDRVLAWELAQLRAAGYRPSGAYWLPPAWWRTPATYRAIVTAIARTLRSAGEPAPNSYEAKAADELGPLLDLWPHVLAWPTAAAFTPRDLILLRAWPVHPLGLATASTWADGRWCTPVEFFHHDLDHARFKVREDLQHAGITIPDAYVDGHTWDAARGRHRMFLEHAREPIDASGWTRARARHAFGRELLLRLDAHGDRDLGEAGQWLLFELVHEKSLPLEPMALAAALAGTTHVDKLRGKCARGFYAEHTPSAAALDRLDAVRTWLRAIVETHA